LTPTDFIAILALVISTAGFAIQAKQWLESRPILRLSVIADAVYLPDDDGDEKLALTVINRGGAPTQITHMVGYCYASRWKRMRGKPNFAGVVNARSIPALVEPNHHWMGIMKYEAVTSAARTKGLFYVGVMANHSNRKFLVRVPPKLAGPPDSK
jgi:hypothetical protein